MSNNMNEMIFRRVFAKLDKEALKHNLREVRRKTGEDVRVMAVVKANAYGHGVENVVPVLTREGVDAFAVASMWEAVAVRKILVETIGEAKTEETMILVLGYTDPSEYETGISLGIHMAIYSREQALLMAECVRKIRLEKGADVSNRKARVQIKVETGMQRIGFEPSCMSADIIREISFMEEISLEGAFTHFARADEENKEHAELQQARFEEFLSLLEERGVFLPLTHSANSAAIMEYPRAYRKSGQKNRMKMARAGIMLYGLYPSEEMDRDNMKLIPVMTLKAHIIYVKEVEEGKPVGYGGTFVTDKPTRIATVSVGYGDGYPRHLSGIGYMLIHGQKARILGRVCMDQTMVDVTDIPDVKIGDEVELFGKDLLLEDLAKMAGTISYEIICQLSLRVKRLF